MELAQIGMSNSEMARIIHHGVEVTLEKDPAPRTVAQQWMLVVLKFRVADTVGKQGSKYLKWNA